ncbi:MAG TPA: efflux RND transporter periplasmic adaptor subunit [Terriglobia bacterium]|nr:efflux RND transporter periplasmic adaptor subunit [Terriglobia bacterium]
MRKVRFSTSKLIGLLMALSVVALVFASCSEKKGANAATPSPMAMAVPVVVAKVSQRDMPVQVTAIGNVQAYSTVTVKSLVDGEIQQTFFTEGQDVRKGDMLFSIDPRPFQAALHQAEANLARDQAQAQYAKTEAKRYTELEKEGIVSQIQFEQFTSNAQALDAAVRADEAAVENAKIRLSYCSIASPIDGRTGSLLVHPGNLVKTNDTSLVVINQVTPIYVDFSVPEQYLAQIKQHQARGQLRVLAYPSDNKAEASTGVLTFINNSVDASTGTIELKGTFTNRDRRLWPGQFVNVVLDLTVQRSATVVPSQAVQNSERGQYVYVIKPDNTADFRPVTVGNTLEGFTIVDKGVNPGETVVTNGQLRLYPGAKVSLKSEPASEQESTS